MAKTMLNQTVSRPILYAYAQEQIAKTPSKWLNEKNKKIQEFLACIPQIKEIVKNKIENKIHLPLSLILSLPNNMTSSDP